MNRCALHLSQTTNSGTPPFVNPLEVDAAICTECKSMIWSSHRHDFRTCKCGRIFIDGGRDYTRMGFTTRHTYRQILLRFDVYGKIDLIQWRPHVCK